MPTTPYLDEPRSEPLVSQLNALLTSLDIPIPLQSPTDLTPSLLLAILESLLSARIPISPALRRALSPSPSQRHSPRDRMSAKIQTMKIFLGVLETDVLQMDVGLSDVDPKRLGNGEWDEVVFVGELLCWVGRRIGLLDEESKVKPAPRGSERKRSKGVLRDYSPSTATVTTETRMTSNHSDLSMCSFNPYGNIENESTTSVQDISHLLSDATIILPESPSHRALRPRCIHEVPSPLLSPNPDATFPSSSYCDCSNSPPTPVPPVRYSGYISPVDEDTEIESFEASRSIQGVMQASRIWDDKNVRPTFRLSCFSY